MKTLKSTLLILAVLLSASTFAENCKVNTTAEKIMDCIVNENAEADTEHFDTIDESNNASKAISKSMRKSPKVVKK